MSLQDKWRARVPASENEAEAVNTTFRRRCMQLGIIYGDVPLGPDAKGGSFDKNDSGRDREPACTLSVPR